MENALNLRLFTKSCDHPQWRSGYVRSGQLGGTGFKFLLMILFFSFLPYFFFCVLFCLLICFAVFFVFLFLNIYLNNC